MALEIGVQLYSAREAMQEDADSTLSGIAAAGYENVELAGYYGHSPEAFKDLLERNGLRAVAAHVPIARFEDELEAVIAEGKMFGFHSLVVPWLSPEQRTEEFIRTLPAKLNEWGKEVVKAGMRLAYHNHEFEYEIEINDRAMIQFLVADTHPDFVDIEPDLAQIAAAGYDPIVELERLNPRVRIIHAKDRAGDGTIVNVGSGEIDWDAVIAIAQTDRVDYLIVEHNQPRDVMADLGASHRYLIDRLATSVNR
jgi:sugar phosphate isomerase/epimerase